MSTATEDTTKASGAALDSKTLVARLKKAGELEVSGAEPAEINWELWESSQGGTPPRATRRAMTTFSQHALMASMFRMSQAGVVIANATMLVSELLADWSSKDAEPIAKVVGARVPNAGFVAAGFYHRPEAKR